MAARVGARARRGGVRPRACTVGRRGGDQGSGRGEEPSAGSDHVALELLVKDSLELPGFSTLDRMAAAIRAEVNAALFETITGRMTPLEVRRLGGLLEVAGPSRKSPFDGLKRAAGRASWSGFREQVGHLAWVDSL